MSPKTEEQNEEIKQKRRIDIINAGLGIFARRGYHAVKMSDIAAEAGISQGLTYHYFKSKEELFVELVETAYQASSALFNMIEEMPGSPRDKLDSLAMGISQNGFSEESLPYFQLIWQALTIDPAPDKVKKMNEKLIAGYFRILNDIVSEAEIDDPEGTVNAFMSMIIGYSVAAQSSPFKSVPNPGTLGRLFLGGVRK